MQDLNNKLIAAGALRKPGKHKRTKIAVKNPDPQFFQYFEFILIEICLFYFEFSGLPKYKS